MDRLCRSRGDGKVPSRSTDAMKTVFKQLAVPAKKQ
jgi:hypothetical protein